MIYVEERAYAYPLTQSLLRRFKRSTVVPIKHYKDVFNRSAQSFRAQKQSQALILSVKEAPYAYPGAEPCESFGHERFYYTTQMMNCLYDCDYCYLQGLYPCAHLVVFVNTQDFYREALLKAQDRPACFCISYESDLLALEKLTHFAAGWHALAAEHEELCVEVRTRSDGFRHIAHLEPHSRMLLAWSLSPSQAATRYEHRAPSLERRLTAVSEAVACGWSVRLCFEPIMMLRDFNRVYAEFIDHVFERIAPSAVTDAVVDTFRMNRQCFSRIDAMREDTDAFSFPMAEHNGIMTYAQADAMRKAVKKCVLRYLPSNKVF